MTQPEDKGAGFTALDEDFQGWFYDTRSGSVIKRDTDGDDLVVFKSRNDHRGSVHSVLSKADERKVMIFAASSPALYEALKEVAAGELHGVTGHNLDSEHIDITVEFGTLRKLRAALLSVKEG